MRSNPIRQVLLIAAGLALLVSAALPAGLIGVTPAQAAAPSITVHAGQNADATVFADWGFFVQGTGFTANETIKLGASFPTYDGNTVTVNRNVNAAGDGSFSRTWIKVPAGARPGAVTMTASGGSSNRTSRVTLHVVYRPYLALNTYNTRPGATLTINGRNFVAYSTVHVSLTIPRNGAATVTLSRNVKADALGRFSASIDLPGDTKPGAYTVAAHDTTAGFNRYARIAVSLQAAISTIPGSVQPGGTVTVNGGGFGLGNTVTVTANFPVGNGGTQNVTRSAKTDNKGNFSLKLPVPGNAASGSVTVTAASPNAHPSTQLNVLQPAPATSTPAQPSQPSPPPAQAPPIPKPVQGLTYRYIQLWYHTVRRGTWDYVKIQATIRSTLGIWAHVYFPSGQHFDYYQNTDSNGVWSKRFSIPGDAISKYSNRAQVTFQLWHGHTTVKDFVPFTIT